MATAVSWLCGTVLMFLEFGVLLCSALGSRRRSRFHFRLGGSTVVMLVLALGLALAITLGTLPPRVLGFAWVTLLLAALAVAPVLCYQTFTPFRGPSDSDGGGGPGSGPPPPPPDPPRGGAPLPDADQAQRRRRDHNRPNLRDLGPRRPAREPGRRRAPAGPGRP